MDLKFTVIVILSICIIGTSCTSLKANEIRWDLSYKSILNKNNEYDKWLWNWLGHYTEGRKNPDEYTSPISDALGSWKSGKIISSFLIEGPAFHAGEHHTLWAVETQSKIHLFSFIEDKYDPISNKLTKTQYKYLLQKLNHWPERQPSIHKEFDWEIGCYPGYFAFVSVYSQGLSRQYKVTYNDYLGDGAFTKEILKPLWSNMTYQ